MLIITFNFDVRLSLFGALDSNESRTTVHIVGSLLLNLVSQSLFCCECWYWNLVNLIYLHRWHLIKLSWTR